jgi:SAM-dependent methyltransferase
MANEIVNVEQEQAWNEREGAHWVAYADGYDAMSQRFGEALLEASGITPSDHVVDIGCGCGQTTIEAATRASEASALGIDLSEPMLHVARKRAQERGVSNTRFVKADAQVYPFDQEWFDVAISRFGVMFFMDPVAAFANIGRALRASGRLAFVSWQDMLANEWIAVIGGALAAHVPLPDFGEPGGPGPFSLAEPGRIEEILGSAGFRDVDIEPKRAPMRFPGRTPDEIETFLRSMPVAEEMLNEAEPEAAEKAVAAVREALEPRFGPESLELEGAAWLVSAEKG